MKALPSLAKSERAVPEHHHSAGNLNRRRGQDHPNAKLTNREVELVRRLREEGMSLRDLSQKFEVSQSLISMICNYHLR